MIFWWVEPKAEVSFDKWNVLEKQDTRMYTGSTARPLTVSRSTIVFRGTDPTLDVDRTPWCIPPGCRPPPPSRPQWSCDQWCLLGSQPLSLGRQKEWHTLVKILPCSILRLRPVINSKRLSRPTCFVTVAVAWWRTRNSCLALPRTWTRRWWTRSWSRAPTSSSPTTSPYSILDWLKVHTFEFSCHVMSRQLSSSLTFSLEFKFRLVSIYLRLLVYIVYYLCKFSVGNLDQWLQVDWYWSTGMGTMRPVLIYLQTLVRNWNSRGKFKLKLSCSGSTVLYKIGGSCTPVFEVEFITWVWVQATAETAFCCGLVVWFPGSVKALKSVYPYLAMAKWTFLPWPRELWVDWFQCLNWTRGSDYSWTQKQVANSNSKTG